MHQVTNTIENLVELKNCSCRLNDEVAVRKVSAEQKESLKQLQLSLQAMTKN